MVLFALLSVLRGFPVAARSGEEGLGLYQKDPDGIDLVVLYMIMPGMDGNETYDGLNGVSSNLKALLSSGYSIDGLAKTILAKGCDGFIQKPFNMSGLSQKIRELLDNQ